MLSVVIYDIYTFNEGRRPLKGSVCVKSSDFTMTVREVKN